MIARMLLVWLLVMNLGVLAWWAWRGESRAPAPSVREQGVPVLELVSDATPPMTPDTRALPPKAVQPVVAQVAPAPEAPQPATPPAVPPTEAAPVCASFGPFDDEATLASARGRLEAGVQAATRRSGGASARGFNVYLPPLADRAAAVAMAERLRAAGFSDLVVVSQGESVNGIALGRFGSEVNAQKHQAALQAKGFPARIAGAGGEGARYWLDVRAPAGFDAAAARTRIGATGVQARKC